MSERGWFMYTGENDEIILSLEKGVAGIPIESIIPLSARGEGFGKFRLSDYLHLAQTVLITPDDWKEFGEQVRTNLKNKPDKSPDSLPPIDPDFLKLWQSDGELDRERITELFEVVIACWKQTPKIAIEPGLVAQLWHNGMKASTIIETLRKFTTKNGKFDRARFDQISSDKSPLKRLAFIMMPPECRSGSIPYNPEKHRIWME